MFSFDEHLENGIRIQEIYNFALALSVRTSSKYGKSDIATKKADEFYKAVRALKSALDDKVCLEHPDKPDGEVVRVYYRNHKEEAAV